LTELLYHLRDVGFRYRPDVPLLEGLDLDVREGDFIALLGPNGVGKSTLVQLLTGWLRPSSGVVQFRGRTPAQWPRLDFARQVAVVPQREDSAFHFTVLEMVLMGRHARQSSLVGFEGEDDYRIALECLDRVCLRGFESRSAQQLSGGERQRLLLARALAQKSPVLLLDEPTASLDLGHQRMMFALLEELNRTEGQTIVVVSHDINLAAMYARELVVLDRGRIIERGSPSQVMRADLLESVYHLPLRIIDSEDGVPLVQMRR
jgi:iron complex transport system ATP-binding protein